MGKHIEDTTHNIEEVVGEIMHRYVLTRICGTKYGYTVCGLMYCLIVSVPACAGCGIPPLKYTQCWHPPPPFKQPAFTAIRYYLHVHIYTPSQIVVLDSGRVVEQGTHSELLARAGVYKQLVYRQLAAGEYGDDDLIMM